MVRVTVLGSGDAFGSGGRLHSAYLVEGAGKTFLLDCGPTVRATVVDLPQGTSRALVSIRPHHLRIADASATDGIRGTVQVVMPMGATTFCEVGTPDGTAVKVTLARDAGLQMPEVGSAIGLKPASTQASRAFAN